MRSGNALQALLITPPVGDPSMGRSFSVLVGRLAKSRKYLVLNEELAGAGSRLLVMESNESRRWTKVFSV